MVGREKRAVKNWKVESLIGRNFRADGVCQDFHTCSTLLSLVCPILFFYIHILSCVTYVLHRKIEVN